MRRETLILLVVVAALGCALCLVTGILVVVLVVRTGPRPAPPPRPAPAPGPAVPGAPPAPPAPADDWEKKTDPAGFSVELPRGWTVASERGTGRVSVSGPSSEQLLLWPVFVPGNLDSASAPRILVAIASKARPDLRWEPVNDTPRPGAVRAQGRGAGGPPSLALLSWIQTREGSASCVYVVSGEDASNHDTIARILGSFRATGSPSAPGQGSVSYVRWQEPNENAFSVEVPKDWKMEGGLQRAAPTDVRVAVRTSSPDGQVAIQSGDVEIPTFSEPTRLGAQLGFREGTWYQPGTVRMFVRRYVTGVDFAVEWAQAHLGRTVSSFEIVQQKDRPDLVEAMNANPRPMGGLGPTDRATAGEVDFKGAIQGTPCVGSLFVATKEGILQSPGIEPIGLWNVIFLNIYIAAEPKAALAQEVLHHMITSYESNPQWVAMQQNITMESARIQHETSEKISKTISDSYWKRQASNDEISRRRSNATLGLTDVTDPQTGQEMKVYSGSNYYWLDDRGTVVGTDTYGAPSTDFRELIQRP